MNKNPAQIINSNSNTVLNNFIVQYLKKAFCLKNDDNCNICRKIEEKQHENIIWLEPKKQYLKEQLNIIFEKTSVKLETNEKYFFIFQKAELLSIASANSLLKIVEEPPAGYHFIFLVKKINEILPTIRSRCTIQIVDGDLEETINPLEIFFKKNQLDAKDFSLSLDNSNINEKSSIEVLDNLIYFWTQKILKEKIFKYEKYLVVFHNSSLNPPMPGSSKIFWRNIFMQIKSIQ